MAEQSKAEAPRSRGVLGWVERAGNALPDPVFIFLGLIVALCAVTVAAAGWSAVSPVTGERLVVESLISETNVRRLLVEMPATLAEFPPLGLVLVVMLGAAVAERTGLFHALLGGAVQRVPAAALTPAVFLIGLMSHHATDAAYIVLIPLAALTYMEAGRHPLAGIAAAYAGISGAFAGNLLPGQFDILILGITQAAARLVDPAYPLNPLGNWGFTAAIGLVFLPVAWFVTDRIVEPRLGPWKASPHLDLPPQAALGPAERRGLRWAGIVAFAVVAVFAALTWWPGFSPLVDETATGPQRFAPFYRALIAGFMVLFLASGWAFGRATGAIRSHRDVVAMMTEGARSVAPYLVIVFFAAHFVAMFGWSKLGPVLAVNGAAGLRALDLPAPMLLVALLLISSVLDLLIGSASAKWSAMAPVVVPMLMLLGLSPEMTTAAYRMGDSFFNIVTPVAANFPLVLVLCQRWRPDFGVGSLIALMLPYTLSFMCAGLILVASWVAFAIPVGPGAPATYATPTAIASR